MTPQEIKEKCPIMDVDGVIGGLWADREGYVDTTGTVHAYAGAAKKTRAPRSSNTPGFWSWSKEPMAPGTWSPTKARYMPNMWSTPVGCGPKQVGRMVGLDLPLAPLQHHYLVTDAIPEIAALDFEIPMMVDLEGFTYMRQDQHGVLVGIYEKKPQALEH